MDCSLSLPPRIPWHLTPIDRIILIYLGIKPE